MSNHTTINTEIDMLTDEAFKSLTQAEKALRQNAEEIIRVATEVIKDLDAGPNEFGPRVYLTSGLQGRAGTFEQAVAAYVFAERSLQEWKRLREKARVEARKQALDQPLADYFERRKQEEAGK